MVSFSFKVKSQPGSRQGLRALCQHYNLGKIAIRAPYHRLSDGDIEYTVDVSEATEYGIYFMGWMDRWEYDMRFQGEVMDRPALHDAWLRWYETTNS
jgi:hypothetical protein